MEGRKGKGEKRRGERGKGGGWTVEGGEGGKEGMKGKVREGRGGDWGGGAGAPSPHMTCLRHAPASIAAAEKCPLSYQTPQSVRMVRNCGAQTLPLTMHYGGKK